MVLKAAELKTVQTFQADSQQAMQVMSTLGKAYVKLTSTFFCILG